MDKNEAVRDIEHYLEDAGRYVRELQNADNWREVRDAIINHVQTRIVCEQQYLKDLQDDQG